MTRPGLRRRSSAGPRPIDSRNPDAVSSIRTSARSISSASSSRSRAFVEVAADAPLQGVVEEEERARLGLHRHPGQDRYPPRRVTLGRLHLHHVGAEVGEQLAAVRSATRVPSSITRMSSSAVVLFLGRACYVLVEELVSQRVGALSRCLLSLRAARSSAPRVAGRLFCRLQPRARPRPGRAVGGASRRLGRAAALRHLRSGLPSDRGAQLPPVARAAGGLPSLRRALCRVLARDPELARLADRGGPSARAAAQDRPVLGPARSGRRSPQQHDGLKFRRRSPRRLPPGAPGVRGGADSPAAGRTAPGPIPRSSTRRSSVRWIPG